ncbi:hypothetical protein [Sphingomonas kyeonggiensis]|uniref:Uncharacterized protein n=1 Tax=Sphingomonas kyeonggiensis TaxID=1268553 RepID=A0A7W6JVS1_9SPHN|nr:hypothetical protein [Sphingomonas kyeonggiensis]MBB4100467.1 hypothetical protein [Sphingomonas kyeonggiensis]
MRVLFIAWVAAACFATLFVSLQILGGRYGTDGQIALNWLLGQYTPTLSILLAAVFSKPSKKWRDYPVDQWRFRWAVAISAFQIVLMISMILLQPAFNMIGITAYMLFDNSQALLFILQGVAVAAVGAVIFDGR